MNPLDYTEQKGTLYYMVGDQRQQMTGHFQLSLDRKVIEARKIRGRNRWQLCAASDLVYFIAFEEVK